MLTNIHFTNKNAKNIKHLQLYYRLRFHAKLNGGCISGFKLSHNERYNILPKLKEKGFIKGDYLVSYRGLCSKENLTGIWTDLSQDTLNDIVKFKGWVIASTEASALRSSYRRQQGKSKIYSNRDKSFIKNDWYSCGENSEFIHTKKIEDNVYSGRVYNGSISNITNISNRSISRWRKGSTNKYSLNKISSPVPFIKGREETKMYRNKDLMYITIDLLITNNILVFNTKYYSNLKSTPCLK